MLKEVLYTVNQQRTAPLNKSHHHKETHLAERCCCLALPRNYPERGPGFTRDELYETRMISFISALRQSSSRD